MVSGRFEQLFKAAADRNFVLGLGCGLDRNCHLGRRRIVGAQGGREGLLAGQIAEHPQNIGGLGAVVDGRDGLRQGLTGAFAGAGGLGQGQSCAAGLELAQGGGAPLLLFHPKSSHEGGHTLVEPGRRGRRGRGWRDPGAGKSVDQSLLQPVRLGHRSGFAEGRGQ